MAVAAGSKPVASRPARFPCLGRLVRLDFAFMRLFPMLLSVRFFCLAGHLSFPRGSLSVLCQTRFGPVVRTLAQRRARVELWRFSFSSPVVSPCVGRASLSAVAEAMAVSTVVTSEKKAGLGLGRRRRCSCKKRRQRQQQQHQQPPK